MLIGFIFRRVRKRDSELITVRPDIPIRLSSILIGSNSSRVISLAKNRSEKEKSPSERAKNK